MRIKEGVSLKELQPQMSVVFVVVSSLCSKYGVEAVLTSGSEGQHGDSSLHKKGLALDFRTHDLHDTFKVQFVNEIRLALSKEFDVVLEYLGDPNEHMHVEYDPKKVV